MRTDSNSQSAFFASFPWDKISPVDIGCRLFPLGCRSKRVSLLCTVELFQALLYPFSPHWLGTTRRGSLALATFGFLSPPPTPAQIPRPPISGQCGRLRGATVLSHLTRQLYIRPPGISWRQEPRCKQVQRHRQGPLPDEISPGRGCARCHTPIHTHTHTHTKGSHRMRTHTRLHSTLCQSFFLCCNNFCALCLVVIGQGYNTT